MSRPSSTTWPAWGRCSPHTTLNTVVLPAPFGPMTPVPEPRSTGTVVLVSAALPPNGTDTPRASRCATSGLPACGDRRHRGPSVGQSEGGVQRDPVVVGVGAGQADQLQGHL